MRDNLLSTANILAASCAVGVSKLVYLASSCMYPKHASQPMTVDALGSGLMEPTSEAYSTAKFAGWKLVDAYRREYGCRYITAIPANAFGPHDDFDPASGHVIPSLIRRTHDAKLRRGEEVRVWGTGSPRREFIYSRDVARACVFVAQHYDASDPINLGGGRDMSISEVAQTIADVVGYRGRLHFDPTYPDGAPLKRLDASPLRRMGWKPSSEFTTALAETYDWFLQHRATEGLHASETL
jgi:GDP-L-fucose synthase